MAASKYEFEYEGRKYTWDRNTLRSREGRAEIVRMLTARIAELSGSTEYLVHRDLRTARNVIEALQGNPSPEILRAIEDDISAQISAAADQTIQQEQSKVAETTKPDVDVERVREMNRIAATPEGRIALQRARTGQPLDAKQTALVQKYSALELAHNEVARAEVARQQGGTFKATRPHFVPRELYSIDGIKDPRERAHAIRALRNKWRDNPKSAFSDVKHPDHKTYVDAMRRLYEEQAALGPTREDLEG